MSKKNTGVVDPKTIAVPRALRQEMGVYAEAHGIHIYEVVQMAWDTFRAANAISTGNGTGIVAVVLPVPQVGVKVDPNGSDNSDARPGKVTDADIKKVADRANKILEKGKVAGLGTAGVTEKSPRNRKSSGGRR